MQLAKQRNRHRDGGSDRAFFPLTTVFLVTSIALLRERVTGTLERLLTSPLGRLELLGGYALSFGLFAAAQGRGRRHQLAGSPEFSGSPR